jgi:tRNA (guanine37-N1)-methyltransferase
MNVRKKTIWVLTLFEDMFEAFKHQGIIGKVLSGERKLGPFQVELRTINLRDFSIGHYKSVDGPAYGGRPGMVIRADVCKRALEFIRAQLSANDENKTLKVIYPCPRGATWNAQMAANWAERFFPLESAPIETTILQKEEDLVFLCGRYEGIDERFIEKYVDEMVSLGDFVLSGGELATMAIIDSLLRLVPGSLGNQESLLDESFQTGGLDYPVYTKPRDFEDQPVPEILTGGHHRKIEQYLLEERLRLTKNHRPDLLDKESEENV